MVGCGRGNETPSPMSGCAVGRSTIIEGSGPLMVGEGPVQNRSYSHLAEPQDSRGVSALWLRMPNGNGEVTGLVQIESLGILGSTDLSHQYLERRHGLRRPTRAAAQRRSATGRAGHEGNVGTLSSTISKVGTFTKEHVLQALEDAGSGPVMEGCVGGDTGWSTNSRGRHRHASRRLPPPLESFTVGVLVQANHGAHELLRIDGVPVRGSNHRSASGPR